MSSRDETVGSRRGHSWVIVWAVAGVVVAMGWMLIDFIIAPSASQSASQSLDLAVAMDYARIFMWPSSLIALYSQGSLSVLALLLGAALNSVTYLAFGWLARFCNAHDRWLLLIPVGLLAGWLTFVLQL